MKKLLTTSLLALIACFTFQTEALAQHDVKFGVGVAYDDAAETAGIQANATFRVSQKFGIAPSATFYFTDEDEGPYFDSYLALNLDGHYMLVTDPEYHIYALGGLNVTTYDRNDEFFDNGPDDSETELGLNLGLGGEYHLDNFSLFSDLKYVFGGFDRVVLAVGVRFPI